MTVKADPAGYLELADWLSALGEDLVVGVEGTGTYVRTATVPFPSRKAE